MIVIELEEKETPSWRDDGRSHLEAELVCFIFVIAKVIKTILNINSILKPCISLQVTKRVQVLCFA